MLSSNFFIKCELMDGWMDEYGNPKRQNELLTMFGNFYKLVILTDKYQQDCLILVSRF